MLTAAGRLGDRVEGLDVGADDYLGKPFEFAELVARLHALQRRHTVAQPARSSSAPASPSTPARREVTRDGRPVDAEPKELAVLEVLLAPTAAW